MQHGRSSSTAWAHLTEHKSISFLTTHVAKPGHVSRYQRLRSKERAAALISSIRIVKPQPVPLIAALLDHLFSSEVGASCPALLPACLGPFVVPC